MLESVGGCVALVQYIGELAQRLGAVPGHQIFTYEQAAQSRFGQQLLIECLFDRGER